MNFAAVDLNLLRVFDAMMLELSTARAGERVGLSQHDVSAAVGRLRHVAGDELFVREGSRMVPTPRALQLVAPLREALKQIEETLARPDSFEPSTAADMFILLAPDHIATLLAPRLAARMLREAPAISAKLLDHPDPQVFGMLGDGLADVAIDRTMEVPDWIGRELVFHSTLACVARKRHPTIALSGVRPGERILSKLYCAGSHVIMSADGGRRGSIDPILESRGLSRRVAMTLPSFHAVAAVAAETDLIGSLPSHVARQLAPLLDLEIYQPPFDLPGLDVSLYWHRKLDKDPANGWLRSMVVDLLAEQENDAPVLASASA